MKILLYVHELGMGGSQINAIELGGAMTRAGHDVVVYAPDGILRPMIGELGMEYIEAPQPGSAFSQPTYRRLNTLVRTRRFDIVHSYEWFPSLISTFGPNLRWRTPTMMTVLSMDVPDFLPAHLPIVVGTRELLTAEAGRRNRAHLMEPPIDTELNKAGDDSIARSGWGFSQDELVVSVVCRLSTDLEKLEGVITAIGVVGELAHRIPVRLLVVGDGSGKPAVDSAARRVNSEHGRDVIVVTGSLLDPRPAYAASDVVIGMGSSALKGMSFAKPLVVQGTGGFWRVLDETTLEGFLFEGWFGHGGRGAPDLRAALERLLSEPHLREQLGLFGRRVVTENFSLESAALALVELYRETIAEQTGRPLPLRSLARTAFDVVKFRMAVARQTARSAALNRIGVKR